MTPEHSEQRSGERFLFLAAAVVVVVAGLKLGAPVLLPFALATFLAMMSAPVMFYCQRHLPAWAALTVTLVITATVFGVLIGLATQSAADLQPQLPRYRAGVENLWANTVRWMESHGFVPERYLSPDLLDPDRIFDLVGGAVRQVASFFSSAFIVFLILAFMLAEATVIPYKVAAVMGRGRGTRRYSKIVLEVQAYLGIKTVVSLGTGLTIGLFAWAMGLDFPVMLGIIGYVLNYVPTIGSILAAVPALVLSLLLVGTPAHAGVVALGYIVINTVFGSILEPNLMGRRLGLSTLVVMLSLLFWGWVWGPVGALLSVPLTMIVKIMLENTEDLRWVAMLLDKQPPQAYAASRAEAGARVRAAAAAAAAPEGVPEGGDGSGPGTVDPPSEGSLETGEASASTAPEVA